MDLLSNLLGRDPLIPLPPQQNDFVPYGDTGNLGDIHHDVIHADPPDDGCSLPTDQHFTLIRESVTISIRISDGEGGNETLPPRHEGSSITDPCSGRDRFQEMDPSIQGHQGVELNQGPRGLRRIGSIQHDPRAD